MPKVVTLGFGYPPKSVPELSGSENAATSGSLPVYFVNRSVLERLRYSLKLEIFIGLRIIVRLA